jgi:hypothetical protein
MAKCYLLAAGPPGDDQRFRRKFGPMDFTA